MKKLTTIALVFICFLTIDLKAQDKFDEESNYISTHSFGVNAGFTTGLGFSYRYWPARSGFQVTAFPLYDKTNKMLYSFGTTYLFDIKQHDYSRYLTSRVMMFASNHITNFSYDKRVIDNIGLGIGLDLICGNAIVNFMLGYGALDVIHDFKTRPIVEFGVFLNI